MQILRFLLIMVLVSFFLEGCSNFEPTNLKFNYSECDTSLSMAVRTASMPEEQQAIFIEKSKEFFNETIIPRKLGLQEYSWDDAGDLKSNFIIFINCADEIKSGNYVIEDGVITFQYYIKSTKIRAQCSCAHELEFVLTDIAKKNYSINLQEVII